MRYTNDWIRRLLPAQLQECVARVTGVPLKSVTVYNRVLREAGLLTQRGRGIASPSMTPLDAARLLLAICVASGPADAVQRYETFQAMRCGDEQGDAFDAFRLRGEDVGPVEVLATLIEAAGDGGLDRFARQQGMDPRAVPDTLQVAFMLTGSGMVQVQLATLRGESWMRSYVAEGGSVGMPSMKTVRYLEGAGIYTIGRELRG